VQFRAFGQKNPLHEYQREALKAFNILRSTIAREVSSYIFRLEAVEQRERPAPVERIRTVHSDFDIFTSVPDAQQTSQHREPAALVTNRQSTDGSKRQPVRAAERVGRNDLCPCGSGKKYKKCHGVSAG
jgi:preprotein translocase subunit SecA